MNLIQNFKSLPISTKRLLGLGAIFGFAVALPLFVWVITSNKFNFNYNKMAADVNPAPDDVYFVSDKSTVSFTTIDQSPNVSVTPNNIQVGKSYLVNVNFTLQNTLKQNYPNVDSDVTLIVNNLYVAAAPVNIPLIAAHQDGASYSINGIFAATKPVTTVTLVFDINNKYNDSDKTNNSLTFNFGATPSPTPTPTPEPTNPPPNACGGTCGSDYNCAMNYFCYQGFCRNPICPSDKTCGCISTPTPQPSATPTLKPIVTPPATPEVVYYNNQVALSIPTATPVPTNTPSKTASPSVLSNLTSIDPKYLAIGAFSIVTLVFAISSLLKALKR